MLDKRKIREEGYLARTIGGIGWEIELTIQKELLEEFLY